MNERHIRPTDRQLRYLRYLTAQAHSAGVPYLPIDRLHRDAVEAWITYLEDVNAAAARVREVLARAEEHVSYFATPARDALPSTYRPPYQELAPAEDHEHLVGSVTREDGVEESVCVLCGVST